MNICIEKQINTFKFEIGNLYQYKDTDSIYMLTSNNTAVGLKSGVLYWEGEAKENFTLHKDKYTDVTDQYCLQKVK